MAAPQHPRKIALALQGGGSYGAFTWGVLESLLDRVADGQLSIGAISGASAGAINATLTTAGLIEGGPEAAQRNLAAFWESLARSDAVATRLLGLGEPGAFGWNLDNSPAAALLGIASLFVSPYTNPFYADGLTPLLQATLPPAALAGLNAVTAPRVFINATNIVDTVRTIFTQPHITIDTLRASTSLPTDFRAATIAGIPYWDGGYLGNPALTPLIGQADDIVMVLINPMHRDQMPPRSAPEIIDRINELTFNAALVLEINAIEAVNKLLGELEAAGTPYGGRYRRVHLHLIQDEALFGSLGYLAKNSTSLDFLTGLRDRGRTAAAQWFEANGGLIGVGSSVDVRAALTRRVLERPV